MNLIVGNKIIKNHELCKKDSSTPRLPFIYEVIKVKNSVPVFLKEHYLRMMASNGGEFFGYTFENLKDEISQLGEVNGIRDCNVKFVFDNYDVYLFYIKSFYPDAKYHDFGADVVTANIMRNRPNMKLFNSSFAEKANEIKDANEVYEVLLVNDDGFITEGSKSNVFFIKDGVVYTAPDDMVLLGVTRDKVIESIKELGIPVVKRAVRADELANYDTAFLTGTSIDVFKIRKINDIELDNDDKLLQMISNNFLKKVDEDIS